MLSGLGLALSESDIKAHADTIRANFAYFSPITLNDNGLSIRGLNGNKLSLSDGFAYGGLSEKYPLRNIALRNIAEKYR